MQQRGEKSQRNMSGASLRLARLFNQKSGNAFMVAIDHGLVLGVQPGIEDAPAAVERIITCNPDAVLLSPGLLTHTASLFAFRGAPAIILRIDFLTLMDKRLKDLGEQHRLICSPKDAVALGADAVIMFFPMGVQHGAEFADNAQAVAKVAREADDVGIPLIVEATLWGSRITDQADPDQLAFVCRMAAELGAHVVKTEYTGNPETMAHVIAGCPAPVLTLGGARAKSESDFLAATRGAITAGAKGVIYGRNIWQADDPRRIAQAIREIVHGPTSGG
jgi:DhnA family fructose-bisphosphate aldolase class Ia